jgi:hypothetical protein
VRGGWAWRLFVIAAYSAIVAWTWQLGLVELFEHHDEEAQECPDDEGPCDCGTNCHCCLMCAHHIAPTVAPSAAEGPLMIVDFIELALCNEQPAHASVVHGPPPKVPKHLS